MNRLLVCLFVSCVLGAGTALVGGCDSDSANGTPDTGTDAPSIVTDAGDAGRDADATLMATPDGSDAAGDADATLEDAARDAGSTVQESGATDGDAGDGNLDVGDATDAADAPGDADGDAPDVEPTDGGDAEASLDDGPGEAETTASVIQTSQTMNCYNCGVTSHCFDPGSHFLCEELDGAAAAGPAAGQARVALCIQALQCIATTNCPATSGDLTPCFCGDAGTSACRSGAANGACAEQELAGMETFDASAVISNLMLQPVTNLGSGIANRAAGCLINNCPCFGAP
jgi:hypothetical protein